ncbi:MAG: tRNA methyl transferase PRC-barrel domain-containing protein, partial [Bosea sp. (in: a-proteobacteria)]
RELAAELGLAIADKPDSQDICFVPSGRYADVIERLKPGAARPGEIVDMDGRVLGRHDGILNFTVGQRKGIGIAASEALYVIKLDAEHARVIVGPRAALATKLVRIRDINWLGDKPLDAALRDGIEVAARVRSTRAPKPALLREIDGEVVVELFDAEEGVAPGQACVLYDSATPGARVLGGGIIRPPAMPRRDAPIAAALSA